MDTQDLLAQFVACTEDSNENALLLIEASVKHWTPRLDLFAHAWGRHEQTLKHRDLSGPPCSKRRILPRVHTAAGIGFFRRSFCD